MYIISTTFAVDPPVHGLWYKFVTEKFLPRLEEESGESPVFMRVLSQTTEDHYTYSVQCRCADIPFYHRFMGRIMADYMEIAEPMFGDKVLYFTTLLKRIDYR